MKTVEYEKYMSQLEHSKDHGHSDSNVGMFKQLKL